jgi:Zn-dependent peptidase ImmA (M78 family)/transcriptional regulator with XRE-family HTH domain
MVWPERHEWVVPMYTTVDQQLSDLLQTSIESLDISDEEYRLAVSRYEAVGQFLADYWDSPRAGGEVYPQGSMQLGTVTRNIHRNDEIDIDLVARHDIDKKLISQDDLKADVGHALELFLKSGPEGDPSKKEGKRCWTLIYSGFHVDVLPALPNEDDLETGIVITDKAVRRWLPSNPIGYADWFHRVMRREWLEKRAELSARGIDVADVPEWAVKTTLQRTVQALKRHRDLYFENALDDRPPSMIITTLAARAYRGGGSLYEVLLDVTGTMPTLIERRDGVYVVANPVQKKENFADRWQSHPHLAQRFFEWIEQACADLSNLGSERGVDIVLEKLGRAFGRRVAERAGRTDGVRLRERRAGGHLSMASGTGALVTGNGSLVRPHTFHGDPGPGQTNDLAEKLRRARERTGLSQEAAANALGINRVVLSYYETGRRSAPLPTAAALARLYGTTLDRLVAGNEAVSAEVDVSGVLYRAAPPVLNDAARGGLRIFEQYLSDYVELAHELNRPLPGKGQSPFAAVTGSSARDGADAARQLRRYLNLGGGPLGDAFRAADEHVLIWRLPLGEDLSGAPSGLFYNHPQVGFSILVNSNMTLGRQVFTVAHELAHAFFHSRGLDVIVSMPGAELGRERFADAFAGELLIPGDELRRLVAEHALWTTLTEPSAVVHLQRHFGVSYATIRVRLLQERLIDRVTFDKLAQVSPSRLAQALGYPVHRADMGDFHMHPLERFPGRMLALVQAAVEEEIITPGDAAETLSTSTHEIRQLLARPPIQPQEQHIQRDLEDAVFAHRSGQDGDS